MSRVFLSCVTDEFGPYRAQLAAYLRRARCFARYQQDLSQVPRPTLLRLDEEIRECDAVVHFLGEQLGKAPPREAVDDFYREVPEFRAKLPIDDAYGLTYTQWEAYLAAYRGIDLFLYRIGKTVPVPEPHDAHFRRVQGLMPRPTTGYPERCEDTTDHLGKLIGDLGRLAPRLQQAVKPNNLPFRSLGALFKGRGQYLEDLRAKLTAAGQHAAAITPSSGRPTALSGVGGVGKTRAAIEYAWKHYEDYTALLFVAADSPESLETNLAQLTDVFGMQELDTADHPERLQAALAWLQAHPGWLVILDNVDRGDAARAVRQYLARLCNGHVVITSRIAHWTAGVELLDLDVLDVESARDYLLEATEPHRRRQATDVEDAQRVANDVGQLSLGLEHAAAFINEQGWTLARYHEEWEARQGSILDAFNLQEVEYPRQVLVTWQMSVDRVSELARELLGVLSWFAPDPIPESLIEEVPNDSERRLRAAFNELVKYSLVRRDRETPVFTVHRLVQATTRLHQWRAEDTTLKHSLGEALRWLDAAMAGDPEDASNWPKLVPLQPHADMACDAAREFGLESAEYPTTRILDCSGRLYTSLGRYGEAEPRLRRALNIDERVNGREHPNTAMRLNNLASLLKETNRLVEAEQLMRRALNIVERTNGSADALSTTSSSLAQVLKATNRVDEAESLMRRALSLDEAEYGPQHLRVAIRLNNLAQLLKETNRLADAEPLMHRSLSIAENAYGPEHPNVTIPLNNLAQLLKATNRMADAEPLMRRALSIAERTFGPERWEVATCLNNLASLLQRTDRLVEAEPLMRRGLSIVESVYGQEHPSIATVLNNLAQLLVDMDRLNEAEPLMRRALSIDESAHGLRHANVARDLSNLALLLHATNRATEAEPLMRRALSIAESAYRPDHPNVATHLNNLAQLLHATNRLTEAVPLMDRHVRILATFKHQTGHEHPHMKGALKNYRGMLRAMGRSEDEIRAAQEEALGVEAGGGSDE